MGFLSWYLIGKFQIFNENGRGQSWRLILSITPLITALIIALSRTCDYHHHWQDVVVGSLIGLGISYLCYRQYYPQLASTQCNRSYLSNSKQKMATGGVGGGEVNSSVANITMTQPLMCNEEKEKENKWI